MVKITESKVVDNQPVTSSFLGKDLKEATAKYEKAGKDAKSLESKKPSIGGN